MAVCSICSASTPGVVCEECIRKGLEAGITKREAILQSAMDNIKSEATKLYQEKDINKGRGRGPIWLME